MADTTTPTSPYEGFYRHFDGMCWPVPSQAMHDVAYALIHAQTDVLRTERLLAASVLEAYAELIRLPAVLRNARVKELRQRFASPAPQELPPVLLPELPKVGPICYAMAADVELYKVPRVGNHIPGVYDVALYSADQMRAYALAAIAADRRAGGR
jgi:hypothetical protein